MGKDIQRIMAFARTITHSHRLLHLCLSCSLILLTPLTAGAEEESPRDETVLTRPRPEVTPLGITTGDFLIMPRLTLSEAYDDNILATEDNKQSGFRTELSPELAIHSNWGTHALNLLANSDIGHNSEFSSEDYSDWTVSADGRLDILHSIQLFGGADGGHDHVDRTAPDDANGLEPTQFDYADGFGRYVQQFGRFSFQFNGTIARKDYQDSLGLRRGRLVAINEDDRDRNEYGLGVRGGYEIMPDYEAYIRLTENRRDYDDLQDVINADRSSNGYEAVVGMSLDLGGVTFGDVFIGYLTQNYKYPFPDIDTPVFGTALTWNPTGLTTVNLAVERSINEAINISFSGYTNTSTSLTVDHELLRDLLLKAGLNYETDKYEGIGPAERDDTTYDFLLGPTYLASRYLHVSLQYHFLKRESDDNTVAAGTADKFDKNLILLQLNTQL